MTVEREPARIAVSEDTAQDIAQRLSFTFCDLF
jgi:hypothetical protein